MSFERFLQSHKRVQSSPSEQDSVVRRTAIRPVPDRDLPSRVHEVRDLEARAATESGLGHDFSQVPVHSAGLAPDRAPSCPFAARRCPFGGACHTCSVQVPSGGEASQRATKRGQN